MGKSNQNESVWVTAVSRVVVQECGEPPQDHWTHNEGISIGSVEVPKVGAIRNVEGQRGGATERYSRKLL